MLNIKLLREGSWGSRGVTSPPSPRPELQREAAGRRGPCADLTQATPRAPHVQHPRPHVRTPWEGHCGLQGCPPRHVRTAPPAPAHPCWPRTSLAFSRVWMSYLVRS